MAQEILLVTGEKIAPQSSYYGEHLVYVPQEGGLPTSYMDLFEINPDLPKVPGLLWHSLMSLFFDYADQHLEVHSRILLNPYTQEWKVLIPAQYVSAASTSYDYSSSIDLISGRSLNYPVDLPSFDVVWQVHSHNTMALKQPSTIDDYNVVNGVQVPHELGTKQGYCVVSNIDTTRKTYVTCFTVVSNDGKHQKNRRYFLPDTEVGKLVDGLIDGNNCQFTRYWYNNNVHQVISRFIAPLLPPATTYRSWENWEYQYYDSAWNVDDEVANLIQLFGFDAVIEALDKLR